MKCDKKCAPGNCVLNSGCMKCQDGYYTSREDIFWPLECLRCNIENCGVCKDNSLHFEDPMCAMCKEGYSFDFEKDACAPIGKLLRI